MLFRAEMELVGHFAVNLATDWHELEQFAGEPGRLLAVLFLDGRSTAELLEEAAFILTNGRKTTGYEKRSTLHWRLPFDKLPVLSRWLPLARFIKLRHPYEKTGAV